MITISRFELLPGKKVHSGVIHKEKTENPDISHELKEVYYLLEEFFVDIFSLSVERDRPRDYLFSALLSSAMIFHPVASPENLEAFIYPSVQKKKFGYNFAIRNDLIFDRYKLHSVETRFILDEYREIDPSTEEVTADQIISSFWTNKFDFASGKILYKEPKATEIFEMMRSLQTGGGAQTRYDYPGVPKNLTFYLGPDLDIPIEKEKIKLIGRNERVNVVYKDGIRKNSVRFKFVKDDVEKGICNIVNY